MKNIIKISTISLILISFAISCNDEFLERYPLNEISDATFWKTPSDLKMVCNAWYSNTSLLPSYTGAFNLGPWAEDCASDIEAANGHNSYLNGEKVVEFDNDGWGQDDWLVLRQINYFMDNYKKVEDLTSFNSVKQYVGEALFFRSLFYFKKLQRYGDLPWAETTVTIGSELLEAGRLPRNQVVDKIMADMDRAVEYLPAQAGGTWTGRITKETAMALQSRIALYEGTWEKYHANDDFKAEANQSRNFLEKAAKVAGDLIAMSETSGFPALDNVGLKDAGGNPIGYRDLFNQLTYEKSKEVIFWRKYQSGLGCGLWHAYTHEGGQAGATKSLIDSYLKIDGTPVAAGYDDATLLKVAEGRDPRLAQTININDGLHYRFQLASPPTFFIAPAFDIHMESMCPTGYQIYKGHDFRISTPITRGMGENALIYFRFGEVLLNYAEAKAELGTITQADLDRSINKLRERAGMANLTLAGLTNDPNFEFKTLSPIIQEVRRERKVELALEGFRFNDIMRWAAAGELIVNYIPLGAKLAQWGEGFNFSDHAYDQTKNNRQEDFAAAVKDLMANDQGYIKVWKNNFNQGTKGYQFNVKRDYLYPIPSNQLSLNKKMKQNPGW